MEKGCMSNFKENTQYEVWCKTCGRCAYCGCDLEDARQYAGDDCRGKFSIDHVLPKCRGGKEDIENLLPVCRSCNSKKRHKTLDEYREYMTWLHIGKFSKSQKIWLQSHGIEIPEPPPFTFYFETIELG